MKFMRNSIGLMLATIFTMFAVPLAASAVNISPDCGSGSVNGSPSVCQDINTGQNSQTDPVILAIRDIISVLAVAIGLAAIVSIIISGFRFMTANGDASKVAAARSALIFSLVGLAVAALAGVIVVYVIRNIGG